MSFEAPAPKRARIELPPVPQVHPGAAFVAASASRKSCVLFFALCNFSFLVFFLSILLSSLSFFVCRRAGPSTLPPSRRIANFGKPPPGYVPGRGRGAAALNSGVREIIVPANVRQRAQAQAAAALAAAAVAEAEAKRENADATDLSDSNFDEFSGYQESLFADQPYDEDDKEADLIYSAIDRRMDSKRKDRRSVFLPYLAIFLLVCLFVCFDRLLFDDWSRLPGSNFFRREIQLFPLQCPTFRSSLLI